MARKYPIPRNYMTLNYDQINLEAGHLQPTTLKYTNSITFAYWQRSLFQRAISTIKFTGLPDTWEASAKDFFYWCVFSYGFVGVFNTEQFGLTFQPGSTKGYDLYYQPVYFKFANRRFSDANVPTEYEIHKDCEVIKLTPDWKGIWDIIDYYALLLSQLDSGINQSIVNSKFAWLLGAKNKAAAEALKKALDKINSGDACVVLDNSLLQQDPQSKEDPWSFLERTSIKNSYITTDQLMDRSTLLSNFDAEIGIRSVPYQKKERLVTAEAESREQDSTARLMVWKATLDSSLKLVNKMFETNIKAELAYEGGMNDGTVEDNADRDGTVSES